MKIAVFSDVHANLPALTAMFQTMDEMQPDAIYCLGDLIGYNVWPNEVVQEIRRRRIPTLMGNHDIKTKTLKTAQPGTAEYNDSYAYQIVKQEQREYLNNLPSFLRVEYRRPDHAYNILFAHGSPRSFNEYITEDFDKAYVGDMMAEFDAHILLVGHSHIPFHYQFKRDDGLYRHVINTGSVGKPKDGNPNGCFAMLTIQRDLSLHEHGSLDVDLVRFPYDVDAAYRAIRKSPLPDELAIQLTDAY